MKSLMRFVITERGYVHSAQCTLYCDIPLYCSNDSEEVDSPNNTTGLCEGLSPCNNTETDKRCQWCDNQRNF